MTDVPDLGQLRGELDDIDRRLVELIARRLDTVAEVGAAKAHTAAPVRDAKRERAVLTAVEDAARQRGVSAELIRRVFREIIGYAVDRQAADLIATSPQTVTVRYPGETHSYAHLAALKHFAGRGETATHTGGGTYAEVVTAVETGASDFAVVPIEDTSAGSINQVYDLLQHRNVAVVGEETLRIDHCIAAATEIPLGALNRILGEASVLEQCASFLQGLPAATTVRYADTAEAMRAVAESASLAYAAVGSPEAAENHGLTVLRQGIGDQPESYARFVVLAAQPIEVDPRVPSKTSLILTTRHEEGALLRCLEILAGSGHSMTKLESRPQPGRPFEYLFFLDFEGNIGDLRTQLVMDELRSAALYVKVLGSYPAKVTRRTPQPGQVPQPSPTEALEAVVVEPRPSASRARKRLVDRDTRAQDTLVRVGDVLVGGTGFVVMAGPCSVESAEQIHATARAVRDAGAHVLRGGVFKPRTSPYAFQGLGWDGLALLAEAGKEVGLPIVTEVMAVEQVARMATTADLLQVGARNMQNFDLLRALGNVDRPILLKRGLSSTIEEWLGAAEYILAAGNQQVILCERGIRTFESATRNTLDLSAVPVLHERTHLPVIIDPSHGTGNRRYVAPMSRAALAVGSHGLLIEVHPEPDTALSDADQSIDPTQFTALMATLARPS